MRPLQAALLTAALLTIGSIPAAAGQTSQGASDPLIAILDSGIDADHDDFTACTTHPLKAFEDLVGDLADPADPEGHGTAVASVAVGNSLGEAPCTPIVVGRVCDQDSCPVKALRAGILWAIDEGATIINLSLGTTVPAPELLFQLDEEITAARDAGALVVVAAGNGANNMGLVPYPSELAQPSGNEDVLVVGAATEGGDPALTTNWDPEVIQAGLDVTVAKAGTTSQTTKMSGTSFAAPNVAGIAAAIQDSWLDAHGQAIAPRALEAFIEWHANDRLTIPYTLEGWGMVEKNEMLQAVPLGPAPPSPCVEGAHHPARHASICTNQARDLGATILRAWW